MPSVVTTCTRDCPCSCGLLAESDGQRVTAIRGNPGHPYTRGLHCNKVPRFLARSNHPERVLHPLRRAPGSTAFTRVTWEQALDELADRLGEAAARDGNASILHYQGFGERTALKLLNMRFWSEFGGVTGLTGTLCGGTGQASMELCVGSRVSHDPDDHRNAQTLVLWGRNPAVTAVGLVPVIQEIRKKGGKVIVIDPLPTQTAEMAGLHIPVRPGGDAWLALAAARVVLERGLADERFARGNAEGFEAFRKMVEGLSTVECAALSDVRPGHVRALAEAMTEGAPAAVLLGWGLHRHVHAHQAIQAIMCLSALTGNMGVPGGGVSQGFEEYGPYDWSVSGEDVHPPLRRLLMPRIGHEILAADAPRVTTALVSAGNPATMAPNSALVARALESLDFLCVMGHFLDDTARRAHLVLPATTFLEIEDVVASYGHNWIGPVNRAAPPRGEARPNHEVYFDLADRLGFGERMRRPDREWLSAILAPTLKSLHATVEDCLARPLRLDAPMVPYADGVYPTPSGRFRFMTAVETPAPLCDAREYPLTLLTTSPRDWLCSELPPPELEGLPPLTLHPDEAKGMGLADGDEALAVSEAGSLRVRIVTDERMRPDTAHLPRGGWNSKGFGANELTLDMVSAVGNGTAYYDTRIRLEKP
ncbi:molybdopterin oxidoreductase [Desulfovibrio sp. X2]|uniref:molybdopterin-dependent oxidoreductase n=1 Tax=Desulfovibrio sp. X2 TaxID=941449 RepID=UPI000358D715|nr:molybdopterin-dependent oxidoreductase [Desulfovibrio sp. X2]EPR41088.1 molybdopterin oxidoreductase [Desulfovibrio sp. X2]